MRRLLRRLRRDRDAGAVTAETLVMVPMLALFVFGVIQTTLYGIAVIDARAAADNAARDGAAYGATITDARSSATTRLDGFAGRLLSDRHVTVTETATTITVTVSGRSPLLGIPVHWSATTPRERFLGGG